jgi:hypothetical protein
MKLACLANDARGIMRGLRLRTTLRNRARRFAKSKVPVNDLDVLHYNTDALIGFAMQIVDEFDRQRAHLHTIPRQMLQSRLTQFDKTCGWERNVWIECREKLEDLRETNERYPPKTAKGIGDAWKQVARTWLVADDKASQAPKRNDVTSVARQSTKTRGLDSQQPTTNIQTTKSTARNVRNSNR